MTTKPRLVPVAQIEPQTELIPVEEVAQRWGMGPQTIRQWITQDMVDGMNRVPGGRKHGGRWIIIRAVFERAMRQGFEPVRGPQHPTLDIPATIAELRAIAQNAAALADSLASATQERKAS